MSCGDSVVESSPNSGDDGVCDGEVRWCSVARARMMVSCCASQVCFLIGGLQRSFSNLCSNNFW